MGGFIFPPYDISQLYESENPVQIIVHQCTYSSGGGGNNLCFQFALIFLANNGEALDLKAVTLLFSWSTFLRH